MEDGGNEDEDEDEDEDGMYEVYTKDRGQWVEDGNGIARDEDNEEDEEEEEDEDDEDEDTDGDGGFVEEFIPGMGAPYMRQTGRSGGRVEDYTPMVEDYTPSLGPPIFRNGSLGGESAETAESELESDLYQPGFA